MRAFEQTDELEAKQFLNASLAIALEKHAKVASTAHNWARESTNVAVQVNIPMPTEQERAEMRALDHKLDAIAAKLRASNGK